MGISDYLIFPKKKEKFFDFIGKLSKVIGMDFWMNPIY